MKKLVVLMCGLLLLVAGTASGAWNDVTVTSHSGHPEDPTVTLNGENFSDGPVFSAYFDFEKPATGSPFVGSATSSDIIMTHNYIGTATVPYLYDANYSAGYRGPMAYLDRTVSKFGSNGLLIDWDRMSAADTTTWLTGPATGTSHKSFYAHMWFKIAATDTTMEEGFESRLLYVGSNESGDNNMWFGYAYGANDSLGNMHGTRSGGTRETWDLVGKKFKDIADGNWHQFEVYLRAEDGAATGQIKVWLDRVLVDSTAVRNWAGTTGQVWQQPNWWPTYYLADDKGAKVYLDDVMWQKGHASTVDGRAAARVVLGDKINWANCTKRYPQVPKSWANTKITFVPRGDFDAGDKAYVFVVTKADAGGFENMTAVDSLYVVAPVIAAGTDSSGYVGESYTWLWTNATDNGGTYWNSGGYDSPNQTSTRTVIDWGDGTSTTLSTVTDTTSTHTYKGPGTYAVRTVVTNDAGTTTAVTNVTVTTGRLRVIASAGGKIALAEKLKSGDGRVSVHSDSLMHLKRYMNGAWEPLYWPVAAGDWVTMPATFDSLASGLNDTVWVHVW